MNKNLVEKNYNDLLKTADEVAKVLGNEEASDEEIEKIFTEMQENITDPAQNFPSNNGQVYNENTNPSQNKEEQVLVSSNPITGVLNTIPYDSENLTEQQLDDLMNLKDEDLSKIEIGWDNFVESVKDMYPEADEAGIKQLLNSVNKYRSKLDFPYFNELPDFIKKEINNYVNMGAMQHQASQNTIRQLKNNLAKELYDTLIATNYSSKMYKDIANYTIGEINKEKEKLGGSVHEFNNKLKEEYEVKFIQKAEELEAKGDEESLTAAKKLREASRMFIQSYTYKDMYNAYKEGKIKVKNIQVDKFNRTCQEFNRKYYNNTLKIRDVGMTMGILDRILDGKYDIVTIKKFIVAFVNYTKNYVPANIPEHVFMYYFIQHILTLDIKIPNSEYQEFNDILINNIHKFLDLIIEKDNQKEELNKKKGMK